MISDKYSHPWSKWFEKIGENDSFRLICGLRGEPKTIRRYTRDGAYCGTYQILHTANVNSGNYLVMQRVRNEEAGSADDSIGELVTAEYCISGKTVILYPPSAFIGMKMWNEYRKAVNGE